MVTGAIEDESAGGRANGGELLSGESRSTTWACHYSDDGRDAHDMNLFTGSVGMTVSTLPEIPKRQTGPAGSRLRLLAGPIRSNANDPHGWVAGAAFNRMIGEDNRAISRNERARSIPIGHRRGEAIAGRRDRRHPHPHDTPHQPQSL
jgi:hypothetical protein